jgi:hypothetical protein
MGALPAPGKRARRRGRKKEGESVAALPPDVEWFAGQPLGAGRSGRAPTLMSSSAGSGGTWIPRRLDRGLSNMAEGRPPGNVNALLRLTNGFGKQLGRLRHNPCSGTPDSVSHPP